MIRPFKQLMGPVQRTKLAQPAEQLFFIFHGWGADGQNLLDIAEALSHDFPLAEFHLPNAPYLCESNTSGYQWFSLADQSSKALMSEADSIAPSVENNIKEKTQHANIDYKKVVLMGFSQGAMLAKHLALTRPNLCGAVVAFSGKLIDVPKVIVQNVPPMILVHGDEDLVIPVEAMVESFHTLRDLGITTDAYRMAELGHGINQAGLELAHTFIKEHLGLGE